MRAVEPVKMVLRRYFTESDVQMIKEHVFKQGTNEPGGGKKKATQPMFRLEDANTKDEHELLAVRTLPPNIPKTTTGITDAKLKSMIITGIVQKRVLTFKRLIYTKELATYGVSPNKDDVVLKQQVDRLRGLVAMSSRVNIRKLGLPHGVPNT
eukprot:3778808-Pleurochrysis_carterae.AAC.1